MSDLVQNLRTFVQVAERRNFSTVAAQSHASHTTIARRIDQLEAHFGARLLLRSTRRIALTRDGERLLDHARAVIEEIDHAEADLGAAARARGVVRVGVTTALGLHYAERIVALNARHPELRIEFAIADWQDSLDEAGLDLAVRVGDPVPEAAHASPLGRIARVLVAAPTYLAARGAPATPADLLAHACIAYGYGPARATWDIAGESWRVGGPFRANSSEAVYRAVASGLGIGLLPQIQVSGDIARGTLRPVLCGYDIAPLTLSVAHRYAPLRMPVRVRAVLDFLTAQFPHAPNPD
ncbi:LysR family transcriptional regulator [Sphingomonas sp. NFR15]|uniref:LysR family transcriptional regulator n=1 Tax=Sphingomonas sp. NFR15 TaxID=1566282 RepID=UPI00088112B0|nr:LysR family transcriptional regulator [Sphingomonas sp. NFR15]SDA24175.1 DNA-binding transcriptional regulator, LysR family [Sphingomonas sp. NFR15]